VQIDSSVGQSLESLTMIFEQNRHLKKLEQQCNAKQWLRPMKRAELSSFYDQISIEFIVDVIQVLCAKGCF
jgi:hypothetical protein